MNDFPAKSKLPSELTRLFVISFLCCWNGHRDRRFVIANMKRQELGGLGLTSVRGNAMYAIRSLVKSLPCFVDGFRLIVDLTANRAFGDVSDNGAGMAVCGRLASRRVAHFFYINFQLAAIHLRQRL